MNDLLDIESNSMGVIDGHQYFYVMQSTSKGYISSPASKHIK